VAEKGIPVVVVGDTLGYDEHVAAGRAPGGGDGVDRCGRRGMGMMKSSGGAGGEERRLRGVGGGGSDGLEGKGGCGGYEKDGFGKKMIRGDDVVVCWDGCSTGRSGPACRQEGPVRMQPSWLSIWLCKKGRGKDRKRKGYQSIESEQ
jgi:hypothetical protein